MRGYEFMFILAPNLDDSASLEVIERVETIVKGGGAEIVSLKPWERRRLAYPIDGHNEGLYMLCYFDAPPSSIAGIERRVRLTEGVLRFIVLRTDEETRERDQAADRHRREERAAQAAAAQEAKAAQAADGKPKSAGPPSAARRAGVAARRGPRGGGSPNISSQGGTRP